MTPDERREFSIGSDGQEHRGSCRIFYAENRCTCRGPAVTPDEPGRAGDAILEFWDITPECRLNRGVTGAWHEAFDRLEVAYGVTQVRRPRSTFRLALIEISPEPTP